MKILFVNYYKNDTGGISRVLNNFADGLQKCNHEIILASTGPYPGYNNYIFFEFRKFPLFFVRDYYLYYKINNLIKKCNIDLVHVFDYRFSSLGAFWAARRNNIPCIIHYHDYWFDCLKGNFLNKNNKICTGPEFFKCVSCSHLYRLPWEIYKFYYFRKKRKTVYRADCHIAVSEYLNDRLKRSGNLQAKVVPNPVSLRSSAEIKDLSYFDNIIRRIGIKTVVLFVGKICRHKGAEIFFSIVRRVLKSSKDIIFILAGQDEKNIYRSICEGEKIENVLFTGEVPSVIMPLIYSLGDIMVAPSIMPEPFGMNIAEAMSAGKVVVASNTGATGELIKDKVDGYLFDPNNIESAAELVIYLANNKKLRESIGQAAKQSSRNFAGETAIKNLLLIYNNLKIKKGVDRGKK